MKQKWNKIKGREVVKVDRRDGLKLVFDGGSWLAVRLAGTEPKVRLYAEGRSSGRNAPPHAPGSTTLFRPEALDV